MEIGKQRLATLPIKKGGLGVLAVSDIKVFAYIASYLQSLELQKVILQGAELRHCDGFLTAKSGYESKVPGNVLTKLEEDEPVPPKLMKTLAEAYYSRLIINITSDFRLDARQQAVLECLKKEGAQEFLFALPIQGLGQTMAPRDYRAVLSYRLMIAMFGDGQVCLGCNKVRMDRFGDHAIHCRSDPGIKHRHDLVRDGLYDTMRRAGIASRKEASLALDGGGVVLRPADILLYNWINGKHTCVDLTCCSPLVGLELGSFEKDRNLRLAVRKKYDKHEKACREAGYEFLPFGFTSFGGLSEEAMELMKRVEKVTHHHLVCLRSTKFVFHRLSFLIQKGIAAQIVSRLPENFVD